MNPRRTGGSTPTESILERFIGRQEKRDEATREQLDKVIDRLDSTNARLSELRDNFESEKWHTATKLSAISDDIAKSKSEIQKIQEERLSLPEIANATASATTAAISSRVSKVAKDPKVLGVGTVLAGVLYFISTHYAWIITAMQSIWPHVTGSDG